MKFCERLGETKLHFRSQILRLALLAPIVGLQDKKNGNDNQSDHDEHPVLNFETQQIEMLNKKFHRTCSSPSHSKNRQFAGRNILFLYSDCLNRLELRVPPALVRSVD
jgi:hypothetical protein